MKDWQPTMTKEECEKEYQHHEFIGWLHPKWDRVWRCDRCGTQDPKQEVAWPGFEHPKYGRKIIL